MVGETHLRTIDTKSHSKRRSYGLRSLYMHLELRPQLQADATNLREKNLPKF